jgi:hypothetical protein
LSVISVLKKITYLVCQSNAVFRLARSDALLAQHPGRNAIPVKRRDAVVDNLHTLESALP